MTFKILLTLSILASIAACSTDPNRAVKANTEIERGEKLDSYTQVGQNDKGQVVAQKKQKLVEQLKLTEEKVYSLESEIYGHEAYGRKGLFGSLRECLDKSGELKRLPTKAVLTKNEERFSGKMVIDENKKLVSLSEEYFLDRIKRFEDYKESYETQKEELEEKLRICRH